MYQNDFEKSCDDLNDEEVKRLFDDAMEKLKNEQPKLDFINEKEAFKKESEFNPHMFLLDSALKSLGNEKISRVQTLDDLTKIKVMFGEIGDGKHSYWNLGSDSYLFFDEGEIKIKTVKNKSSAHKFETKFGPLICQNNGEWGGGLYINHEGEALTINSWSYSFDGAYEYGGRVFVCERSTHLGGSCSLHEIVKEDNGLILNTIFDCREMNFAGYCFEANYLYFYSTHLKNGLYRFNLNNNELECVHWRLCDKLRVNSLVKQDNYVYIYGTFNLVKYDLNAKTSEVFTNLEYGEITDDMYADGKKLFELWEELIIK